MKQIIYVIILMLLFAACGNKQPQEGIVFKKEYQPAGKGIKREERTIVRPKKNHTSTITRTYIHQVEYPNRWILYVHSENQQDTMCFYVHKNIYDSIKTGDLFVFDNTKGQREEPYKIIKPESE